MYLRKRIVWRGRGAGESWTDPAQERVWAWVLGWCRVGRLRYMVQGRYRVGRSLIYSMGV